MTVINCAIFLQRIEKLLMGGGGGGGSISPQADSVLKRPGEVGLKCLHHQRTMSDLQ